MPSRTCVASSVRATMKRALLWAVIGSIVGTVLDMGHVLTGTLTYPYTHIGLQPFWVPFLFAGAGIALGEGHRRVAIPLAGGHVPSGDAKTALVGVAALVFAYGSSGFLRHWPVFALILFFIVFAIAFATTPAASRKALLIHALGAGLMGPLVEILISSSGGFLYVQTDVFGIPLWLPGIYVNAAVASAALDRWFLARG